MNFREAVKNGFSNYFRLRGRATRSEYWWFYLFTLILNLSVGGIARLLGGGIGAIAIMSLLAALVTLVPLMMVRVRRLHDIGRSGWWVGGAFIATIAFFVLMIGLGNMAPADVETFELAIGIFGIICILAVLIYIIVMLIFLCKDSYPGDNVYGCSTRYNAGVSVFD